MSTTLDFERTAPVNLRDLGGIPTTHGPVRTGLAIRADDLSIITDDDARTLVDNGLLSVIDLRSHAEVAITGRGPLATHPVAYHHLPLIDDIGSPTAEHGPLSDHTAFGHMYANMVAQAAPHLASALTIIALAPGSTAFHCAAGRDRTGVLAALLLLTLDADDDAIVADYARTDINITAITARCHPVTGVLLARLGFDLDEMTKATTTKGPSDIAMRTMLALLREHHGEPLTPLRAAGLSNDTIARLQQRAHTA